MYRAFGKTWHIPDNTDIRIKLKENICLFSAAFLRELLRGFEKTQHPRRTLVNCVIRKNLQWNHPILVLLNRTLSYLHFPGNSVRLDSVWGRERERKEGTDKSKGLPFSGCADRALHPSRCRKLLRLPIGARMRRGEEREGPGPASACQSSRAARETEDCETRHKARDSFKTSTFQCERTAHGDSCQISF